VNQSLHERERGPRGEPIAARKGARPGGPCERKKLPSPWRAGREGGRGPQVRTRKEEEERRPDLSLLSRQCCTAATQGPLKKTRSGHALPFFVSKRQKRLGDPRPAAPEPLAGMLGGLVRKGGGSAAGSLPRYRLGSPGMGLGPWRTTSRDRRLGQTAAPARRGAVAPKPGGTADGTSRRAQHLRGQRLRGAAAAPSTSTVGRSGSISFSS
jgi:hypothetical protein